MHIAALLLSSLVGCGGQPTRYEPHHEMMPGPGLFSGSSGAFSWSGASQGAAPAPPPDSRPAAAAVEEGSSEPETYRRYRRAKEADSDEWREFLEWKSWQAYLQWRRLHSSGSPRAP